MHKTPGHTKNIWIEFFFENFRKKPITVVILTTAFFAFVFILIYSLAYAISGRLLVPVQYPIIGGIAGLLATSIGALPVLMLNRISEKTNNIMLSFAAGMMLAASVFSLLLPGIQSGVSITGSDILAVAVVIFGMAVGVFMMLLLDKFLPHEHEKRGPCGPGYQRCRRVWLFIIAITLHNLPEGMAIGVSFAQNDLSVGIPLTTAIALQDIPEGLAVALSFYAVVKSRWRGVLLACASGLMEPLGALIGVGFASGFALAYPVGLAFAAGAMIFVVFHEVIPEIYNRGQETAVTLGLMFGFVLMMVLDTTLG